MPGLVISLDFELFWGVTDSRTVGVYRNNVEGEWNAIPRMLMLFRQYGIRATWATVGMLMCRDYQQWHAIRPAVLPTYRRRNCSNYAYDQVVRTHPKLFFARPLVEQILATPGQELATHTYSHFYCAEPGATPEQFIADLECAEFIAADLGVQCRSIVFPRNQIRADFTAALTKARIRIYRGNPDHWLYRDGHSTPGGPAGRAVRFADTWLPLTGTHTGGVACSGGVLNVPASLFLRPWSRRLSALEPLRLTRLKQAMTIAARANELCHLWWHPHNFGVNTEQNLAALESLLQHYLALQDRYGMRSACMADFAPADGQNAACGAGEGSAG
jgi:peptidoglycan/xylan/chitin deacetylase (PgdA/CDA1 family)